MKKSFRILFLIYSLVVLTSCSSKVNNYYVFTTVDSLMTSAVKDSVFPGAVLLFGIDQNILYHKAFGHFTYENNSKEVDTNSIFDLASVSKVVGTTTAAMILVDRKKLSLDDKVVDFIPEFRNNGKEIISIRNLLLHNSGLPAFKTYYDVYSTEKEIINDIMNLSLDNPVGEKYVYSDLGMITLQKVIEKISGEPLDIFLKKNVFTTLGMNKTMYNPSNELKIKCVPTEVDTFWRMRLLQGEVHDERAYMLNGVAGHAGLFSTANDLSIFVRMLLNKGRIGNEQFISSEIVDNWTTKQTNQSDRALGWDTKSVEGYSSAGNWFSKNSFGHTGYTGTSIWADKSNRLFVILLSNRVHPTRNNRKIIQFRPKIHDAIFESIFMMQND